MMNYVVRRLGPKQKWNNIKSTMCKEREKRSSKMLKEDKRSVFKLSVKWQPVHLICFIAYSSVAFPKQVIQQHRTSNFVGQIESAYKVFPVFCFLFGWQHKSGNVRIIDHMSNKRWNKPSRRLVTLLFAFLFCCVLLLSVTCMIYGNFFPHMNMNASACST